MDRLATIVADQVDRYRVGFDPTNIQRDTLRNEWLLAHMFSNGTTRVFSLPRSNLLGYEYTREEVESFFLRQIEQEEWRIFNNENN